MASLFRQAESERRRSGQDARAALPGGEEKGLFYPLLGGVMQIRPPPPLRGAGSAFPRPPAPFPRGWGAGPSVCQASAQFVCLPRLWAACRCRGNS